MSRESYPELPRSPEPIAEIPVGILASMMSRTIFCISTEESRFTLNGSLLILRPDAMVMVATDGHRLALVEKEQSIPGLLSQFRALLPRKAMAEVLKFSSAVSADTPLRFSGDENHLFFQLGDRLLISRKLTGNFPDFERVLPKEQPNVVVLNRDELRGSLERVMQFSDERSHAVKVRFETGEAKLHSSLSDTGESEESVTTQYDGEEIEISYNAQYLLDFLRAVSEQQVMFRFKEANSAGELRPVSDDGNMLYRYVVMPMRS
jgi:DNA polymerase-3 subunit beta